MCELGLEDKPNKRECCLKLDQTSPSSCVQMLGVTGFVLCGRYEATTNWCNCRFPYGKAPCLKRASKGKDKKKSRTMWKEKETAIWSRSGFRGPSGLSPSLAPAEDFFPDPFTLQPAAYPCYRPHIFLQVLLWLLCSFSALRGSFLLWAQKDLDAHVKPEVLASESISKRVNK